MSAVIAISVVVSARNAELTLAATLASVRAQSHSDWELVLVDDGSTDRTAAIGAEFAAADPRFRVLSREPAGVSAGRNAGIAAAAHPWVLFLDADDSILPDMLERVARRIEADPGLDLIEVGWAARLPDGEMMVQAGPSPGEDLFTRAAIFCPFAIHSVVVRRSLIERVGCFDPDLSWGEDWDLWLRCGRAGARTAYLEALGAIYEWQAESGSTRIMAVLRDGLEVTRRAYRSDPRVPDPVVQHAAGCPPSEQPVAEYHHVAWTAGLAVATGADPAFVLVALAEPCCPTLQPLDVAAPLFYGVLRARAMKPADWAAAWPALREPVTRFLGAVERVSGAPNLAARTRRALANLVLDWSDSAAGDGLDGILGCEIDLARPGDVRPAADTSRIHARLLLDGVPVGRVIVPVSDDVAAHELIRSEAYRQLAWPLVAVLQARQNKPTTLAGLLPNPLGRALAEGLRRRHKRGFEWLERELVRRRLCAELLRPRRGGITTSELERGEIDLADGLPRGRLGVTGGVTIRLRTAAVGRVAVPAGVRLAGADLRRTIERELADELASAAVRSAINGDSGIDGAGTLGESLTTVALRGRDDALASATFLLQRTFPAVRRALGARAIANHLPILAYHQIAEGGRGRAGQYVVDPAVFEAQLDMLKAGGFYTVGMEQWEAARRGRSLLRGRPLLITFDDGYADIAETAWPLLRRYGFTATVFVVTDLVGTSSSWDRHLDVEAPLLDWQQIRLLERDGLRFGSHTATHPALGALTAGEVMREARASLAALNERLDRPAPGIAYPYGDTDAAVRLLIRRAGYRFGFTTRSEPATLYDDLLDLPRIEVHARDSPQDVARKLGLDAEVRPS